MPRKSAAEKAKPRNMFTAKRPPPPDDLPAGAAALWVSICAGVDANYFAGADLTLLEALCRADSQKRACDAIVERDGGDAARWHAKPCPENECHAGCQHGRAVGQIAPVQECNDQTRSRRAENSIAVRAKTVGL